MFDSIEKNIKADTDAGVNKIFNGYNMQYRKFFTFTKSDDNKIIGYKRDSTVQEYEERFDGIFIITSSRYDLTAIEIIKSYKNLQEVELLFDDLKHFVDIRPVRHWLVKRVKAHVFICMLALLLKRVFEINYLKGKAVTEPVEEISKIKLVKLRVQEIGNPEKYHIIPKVTDLTQKQEQYFEMLEIKNPLDLSNFMW